MDRDVKVEVGVEPGAIPDHPGVTINVNRDLNDPRIVKKARLINGPANVQGDPTRLSIIKNKERVMTFNKTVTTKNGTEKNIYADSEEELKEAVKVAEGEEAPTYPNIDVPVAKGHDLVEVQGDLSKELVDGTGAHNSPRDAVRDDGSAEGDSTVPGVPQSIADKVPDRIRVGEPHSADIATQLGQEEIRKAEEAESKKTSSTNTGKSGSSGSSKSSSSAGSNTGSKSSK